MMPEYLDLSRGGWGRMEKNRQSRGCTINLVKEELYDSFLEKTLTAYKNEFGIDAKVYDVVIKDGARKIG